MFMFKRREGACTTTIRVIKISEYLEYSVRWHNDRIFFRFVNKLRGTSQSELNPVKYRNGVSISDKKKELKRDGKNIFKMWQTIIELNERIENVCDNLDVKEDLF